MHPRFLAERTEKAQQRIESAAAALGGEEAAARLAVWDRDPPTRALLRLDATADLLEEVARKQAEPPPAPDEVKAAAIRERMAKARAARGQGAAKQ